ncbi:MAG: hypothetical protein ACHQ5A_06500 [Opitutales bacterium]
MDDQKKQGTTGWKTPDLGRECFRHCVISRRPHPVGFYPRAMGWIDQPSDQNCFRPERRSKVPNSGWSKGRRLETCTRLRAWMSPSARKIKGALTAAGLFALSWGTAPADQPAARAAPGADDATVADFGRVVRLQRYLVSAIRIEKNPWRYAALPGFEVLSRASDEETNWWLDALRRGVWLEDRVMPEDWLPPSPVPYTVIIDATNLEAIPAGQPHSNPILFRPADDALTWGRLAGHTRIWRDKSEAHDDDTAVSNTNVHEVSTVTPAYGTISLERLFRHAPPLPGWLMAGLLAYDYGIVRESFMVFLDKDGLIPRAAGPGTLWVSLVETQRLLKLLKKDPHAKIALLPLRKLFAEEPLPEERLPLWKSEAGLFVRWGLTGPGHEDPVKSRAFRELVRRAQREPVTERMFTDCFGFGYAEMEKELEAFLPSVLAQPNYVKMPIPSRFPEADLREATADQIGRILGDWLRLEGVALRKSDPELSKSYLQGAGRMLLRAYKEDNGLPPDVDPAPLGGRSDSPSQLTGLGLPVVLPPFVVSAARIHDPRLRAVYGLYEHDIGDDTKARELLEAAVKAGVVRPKADVVLAGMRYAEAIGKPLGSKGRLSAQQAAFILEPLQTALRASATPDIYSLMVDTWFHCEAKPAGRDLAAIVEGVALFPRDTRLAYRSALVCVESGYTAQAAGLIDQGLVFATDEETRNYFEQLRAGLATPAVSGKQ